MIRNDRTGCNRRQFIRSGASLAATFLLSKTSNAARATSFSLETLEQDIVAEVRWLSQNQAVKMNLLIPNGSEGNVRPVAKAFSAATGVELNFIEVAVDDINTRMMLDALGEKGTFDIALPATFGLPDLVQAGALLDLSGLHRKYAPADISKGALYTVGNLYDGRLYGYQTDGDVYVMFYNHEFMAGDEAKRFEDRFGYTMSTPQSWSALDHMMEYFYRPQEEKFGGALFRTPAYIGWEYWLRLHAKGILPFDLDMEPRLEEDGAVEALEELVRASQWQYPGANRNGLFDNWRAYASGNIFANIGWGGSQKFFQGPQSKVKGKLTFGATPGGIHNGNPLPVSYFNWGWNYTVSRFSRQPEIAYLFALYATSPRQSTIAVRNREGYFDPFRQEHYEDEDIREIYSDAFLKVHRAGMINALPDLYLGGQGEYLSALQNAVHQVNAGELSARFGLAQCVDEWRRVTRSQGRAKQARQWKSLIRSYPNDYLTKLGTKGA